MDDVACDGASPCLSFLVRWRCGAAEKARGEARSCSPRISSNAATLITPRMLQTSRRRVVHHFNRNLFPGVPTPRSSSQPVGVCCLLTFIFAPAETCLAPSEHNSSQGLAAETPSVANGAMPTTCSSTKAQEEAHELFAFHPAFQQHFQKGSAIAVLVPRHAAAAPLTITGNRPRWFGRTLLRIVSRGLRVPCLVCSSKRCLASTRRSGRVTVMTNVSSKAETSAKAARRRVSLSQIAGRGLDADWWRKCLRNLLGACRGHRLLRADGTTATTSARVLATELVHFSPSPVRRVSGKGKFAVRAVFAAAQHETEAPMGALTCRSRLITPRIIHFRAPTAYN